MDQQTLLLPYTLGSLVPHDVMQHQKDHPNRFHMALAELRHYRSQQKRYYRLLRKNECGGFITFTKCSTPFRSFVKRNRDHFSISIIVKTHAWYKRSLNDNGTNSLPALST